MKPYNLIQGCLTLTFVNALVEDLSLELYGISDVKTLHGFARSLIMKATGKPVKIFPQLPDVIREDAKLLIDKDIDFNKIFHEKDDANEHIQFYRERKKYYGDYWGYSDIVFALFQII